MLPPVSEALNEDDEYAAPKEFPYMVKRTKIKTNETDKNSIKLL